MMYNAYGSKMYPKMDCGETKHDQICGLFGTLLLI